MAINAENIIKEIDRLIELASKSASNEGDAIASEIASGTVAILEGLYGGNSEKCKLYIHGRKQLLDSWEIAQFSSGVLKSIRSEIETGMVGNLRREVEGEVFGDFIGLAKQTLDEKKDVAAVLVCAALEDALKRLAMQEKLKVEDKDMSEVINALKSNGLVKGPQASIVSSYVKLRNKTFHAEWDKIERPEVSSAIGFTEQFLLEHFG